MNVSGKEFVENIDLCLVKINKKRKDLAEYCGVTVQSISDWARRGNFPQADIALKIADFLVVPLEYLMTKNEPLKKTQKNLSGYDFVSRIDYLLKEKNINRQTLADSVGFDSSALSQWKNLNRLPSIRIVYSIASILHVSLYWLLEGKLSMGWEDGINSNLSPRSIVKRIEKLVRLESKTQKTMSNDFLCIKDCVEYQDIISWYNNRLEPSIYQLFLIADKYSVSLEYLLTGKNNYENTMESDINKLAQRFYSHLENYSALQSEDRNIIEKLTKIMRFSTQ